MGTRGIVGVVIDNQPKSTYNHFDSYPTGLGLDVVKFVDSIKDADLAALAEKFKSLTLIDEDSEPTPEQIADLTEKGLAPQNVSTGSDWYAWLRDAQGELGAYLDAGYMPDGGNKFAENSLFCEWGYLVNLDNQSVEVYRGFQKEPHTDGRFADAEPYEAYAGATYYPIKLIATIPFAELTREGMTAIETAEYAEEE